ncbi:virulence RhuM family protein [Trueperella bialowiezensis]|uniref:Virulence protein n=1 Tax=Trueperella bialowiezensis TaxID=312285 RepID=A0A448PEF9_9ACTO|nr:virulence RhuM family protein [Trueperella bialowiezensis]VEI13284.1 Virulence protein [Trueperella bialowiezensis]
MSTGSELVFYQDESGVTQLQVRLEDETVWLSQAQMVELFQTSKSNVSEHISHVFEEGELEREATVRDFRTVRQEGSRVVERDITHYNLDVIISVGYRVKSLAGTRFRQWATAVLREYIIKGFTMDDARMASGPDAYWRELLERIRDIRSSERRLYQQVLDLYATSVDYDPKAEVSREFFATVQNKLHFAAHGHTAAELIFERADATQPFMGLTSFKGHQPKSSDVTVAKNYLSEEELSRLNLIVSAYFDAAELRAQMHQVTRMEDWLVHLDNMLVAMDAPVLENAGKRTKAQADAYAKAELAKYRESIADEPTPVERAYLDTIKAAQKQVEKE